MLKLLYSATSTPSSNLVEAQSVPLLPVLRYKATGQRKRQDWQHTWALQRQEDAIDARTQHPAKSHELRQVIRANFGR